MDAEYVMVKIPGANRTHVWSVHQRRAQALRQWAVAKADQDFTRAEDAIRWMVTTLRPTNPARYAWLMWQDATSSLPMEIPVTVGERIVDRPLGPDSTDLRTAPEDDPFLAPLGRVNVDDVLRRLQEFDPLSWHCQLRQVQHHWFINHQRN